MRRNLISPGTILRPFPAAEDVFVCNELDLARHLHPLVSVDLNAANTTWSGWAHLVSPIEPYGGYIGDHTKPFHSDLLRTNFIGFKLEGDRYQLLGDRRYFLMENAIEDLPKTSHADYEALAEYYPQAEQSYRQSLASYHRHGMLYWLNAEGERHDGNPNPQPLIDQLGGTVGYANWTSGADFPIDHEPFERGESEPREVWPLSPAGNRFEFVASTPGYPYRRSGADTILLFYEPNEKLALLTFDWT
jgi:hypothetical protein